MITKFNKLYRHVISQAFNGSSPITDLSNDAVCPMCNKHFNPNDFRDELSKRQFKISGLCQACQDQSFGTEEQDYTADGSYNPNSYADYYNEYIQNDDHCDNCDHQDFQDEDFQDQDECDLQDQDFQDEDFQDEDFQDEDFQDEDFQDEDFQDEDFQDEEYSVITEKCCKKHKNCKKSKK